MTTAAHLPDGRDAYALTVDLGSGGPKVGLVSLLGNIVWWEHLRVHTTFGSDGAATQDPNEWWRLVVKASRHGVAAAPLDGEQVVAVCVTGQWASTVPVAADGTPVGPCVMWMDTRGARHSQEFMGGPVQGYNPARVATWVRRTAGVPSNAGSDPISHMLFLERDKPQIAARARWYLEPVDYLSMRFSGVAAATHMSMTASWLTDNRRLDRMAYDSRLVKLSGVPESKLPPLVPSGSVVGPVTSEVAAELGISPQAQVVTGMPDLHATTVGSGCVLDHQTHVSIGTSSWISCPLSDKKSDLRRQMATVPGLGRGGYLLGNNQDSAGRCLQWFRDNVSGRGSGGRSDYDDITELAATAPPGSGGVIFTPWLTGERSPVENRAARAGFHNISVSTTQAHLARAVLEGVALNLRWLLAGAEHFTGRQMDPLRMIGGGAQSELWCQIVADVCDRTVERVADPLLCGLRGTALSAAMAFGVIAPAEVRSLVPVDRTFHPSAVNRQTYERLFAEFPPLFKSQGSMFGRLNAGRS